MLNLLFETYGIIRNEKKHSQHCNGILAIIFKQLYIYQNMAKYTSKTYGIYCDPWIIITFECYTTVTKWVCE